MEDDWVPVEALVRLSELDLSLDVETVARLREEVPDEQRLEESLEGLVGLELEARLAVARLIGRLDEEEWGLSDEQVVELARVMQSLEGVHVPVDGEDVVSGTGLEKMADTYVYQEVSDEIGSGGYDLDPEMCFEVLVDAGAIVECDDCGRQELAGNSHRFSLVDGELLCGRCRGADRGVQ